jgi:uncharacterized protein (DUF1697 family)
VQTWVALLRGVNVGGRNRLAMADLRAVHERLGHRDVRTHLQSGNVVFRAPGDEAAVAGGIAQRLAADLGAEYPVVAERARLAAVVAANPFAAPARERGPDAAKPLHVTFLDHPVPDGAFDFDLPAGAPDELALGDRHVYLWCPRGYGRTRLTPAFFERRTGATATDRGWNTVVALAELTAGLAAT